MNLKLLKGYLLLTAVLLILAAAAVLLVINVGDSWPLHVYTTDVELSRSTWLLLAGVGGLLVWWTLRKMLPAGVRAVRQGTALRRAKQTEQRVKDLQESQRKPQ